MMQKLLVALLIAPVAAALAALEDFELTKHEDEVAVSCCSWDNCGECGDTTAYCNSGSAACEGDCHGTWCPAQDDDDDDDDDDEPPAGELYCPRASDMNLEGGAVTFQDNGWTIAGDGRVSSKTAWNLLGGSVEFSMDVSRVAPGVNTNLYTTSPSVPNTGKATYCDIQQGDAPSCMELDVIENNGGCAMASTIHTFATDGRPGDEDCDRWGCQVVASLPADGAIRVRAEFARDGAVAVSLNGVANAPYAPSPSAASDAVVVDTMRRVGAVLESSQWFGWAPAQDRCPAGDAGGLNGSVVRVTNVTVRGAVVQGPTPTTCAEAAEAAARKKAGLRGAAMELLF